MSSSGTHAIQEFCDNWLTIFLLYHAFIVVYARVHCLPLVFIQVDHLANRTYTAAQLKESSIKVASGLVKMKYKKGDVILIFATNCPEYFMLCLACYVLGVIVSTANPVYTPGKFVLQNNDCARHLCFC